MSAVLPVGRESASTRVRQIGVLTLCCVLMLAAPAWSRGLEEAPSDEAAAAEWYDEAHYQVSESLKAAVIWFDEFFGDPRGDFEIATEAKAFLRLRFEGAYSGVNDETNFDVRVRGSADLPKFERKVKLVFTSDADAAISGESLADPSKETRTETDANAGVGLAYLFRDRPGHRFSLAGGVKGGISPDVAVNGRYRYTKPLGELSRLRLTQTLYWKSDDGFGVSSLADFEHRPGADRVWRYTLFGNYGESTDGLEWSTQGTWLRRLDRRTAISVRAGINGETEPRQLLTEGWTTFRYRRNVLRPWLFYEVEPGLTWDEEVNYRTEPTLALRLEVLFHTD